MITKSYQYFIVGVIFLCVGTACSNESALRQRNQNSPPAATAARNITAEDVAKLKWIEGSWRGMDGEKPFFERYSFEDNTAMIVESFSDETMSKVDTVSRFELTNGEFGNTEGGRRSAASVITADSVQFVPVQGGGNSFRFEKQNGGWRAVLEWPATETKPAGQKIYNMEPWPAR